MPEPIHEIPVIHEEHDSDVSAKRIVKMAPKGRSVSYEDTSFIEGDSPAVLDVNTDLGHNARDGYIAVDGVGNITIEISDDSTNYGGVHLVKAGEILELSGVYIAKVRLTWVSNSSYRCFFI